MGCCVVACQAGQAEWIGVDCFGRRLVCCSGCRPALDHCVVRWESVDGGEGEAGGFEEPAVVPGPPGFKQRLLFYEGGSGDV